MMGGEARNALTPKDEKHNQDSIFKTMMTMT